MQKAIMVYKSFNGLTPEYLSELFVNRSDLTEYMPKDSVNKLAVPMPRTNFLKNSSLFSDSGAVLWNSLASDLRQAESLTESLNYLSSDLWELFLLTINSRIDRNTPMNTTLLIGHNTPLQVNNLARHVLSKLPIP